jgi:integral membrane sensor domain MASE1
VPARAGGRLRRAGYAGLVLVAYVATARAGLALDAVSGFATLVWPPSGIALVAVLALGRRA